MCALSSSLDCALVAVPMGTAPAAAAVAPACAAAAAVTAATLLQYLSLLPLSVLQLPWLSLLLLLLLLLSPSLFPPLLLLLLLLPPPPLLLSLRLRPMLSPHLLLPRCGLLQRLPRLQQGPLLWNRH